MLNRISLLFVSFLLVILCSCKKGNEYPLEPVINFKSLTTDKDAQGKDVVGHLTISFTDGDGDIGFDTTSTYRSPPYQQGGPYYYNMVVVYYEKNSSGVWNVVTLTPSHSGRIQDLTPEGKNKALRGDISQEIFLRSGATNLATKYDVFIYDRALHRSNTITTSELIINTN